MDKSVSFPQVDMSFLKRIIIVRKHTTNLIFNSVSKHQKLNSVKYLKTLKEGSTQMAKIVFEEREYKDRDSGVVTKYNYIAIRGTGTDTAQYEVQLKNLVQSEKMALQMIADKENPKGEASTRKSTEEEKKEYADNNGLGLFDD